MDGNSSPIKEPQSLEIGPVSELISETEPTLVSGSCVPASWRVFIWTIDSIHSLHSLYGALVVVLPAFTSGIDIVDSDVLAKADF